LSCGPQDSERKWVGFRGSRFAIYGVQRTVQSTNGLSPAETPAISTIPTTRGALVGGFNWMLTRFCELAGMSKGIIRMRTDPERIRRMKIRLRILQRIAL
jgi:hypothetical protein